jgi:hypothetical protein
MISATAHELIDCSFYDQARHAVEVTAQSDNKVTLNVIKEQMGSLIYDITSMKFEVGLSSSHHSSLSPPLSRTPTHRPRIRFWPSMLSCTSA